MNCDRRTMLKPWFDSLSMYLDSIFFWHWPWRRLLMLSSTGLSADCPPSVRCRGDGCSGAPGRQLQPPAEPHAAAAPAGAQPAAESPAERQPAELSERPSAPHG